MSLRAVTLDAYGTLFDLDAQALPAVEAIVSEQGLALAPERLADAWTERFFAMLAAYDQGALPFRTVRELTSDSLEEVFRRLGVAGDVARGVETWFAHVRRAELYPEARAAVEALGRSCRLAVVSDADEDILAPALERARLPVELVFTSESARCYKIDPCGRLFRSAFEALGCEPHEVAHVGDSRSDVVGASCAGARAVWLSRDGREWSDPLAWPHVPGTVRSARRNLTFVTARDLLEAARALHADG